MAGEQACKFVLGFRKQNVDIEWLPHPLEDSNSSLESYHFDDVCTGSNDPIISTIHATENKLLAGLPELDL